MNPLPINQLYSWRPIPIDTLSISTYNNYPHINNGIVRRSKKPVNRYAKNYTKDGKKFSLCITSEEPDTEKMEKWLDEQAEKINKVEAGFKELGVSYG